AAKMAMLVDKHIRGIISLPEEEVLTNTHKYLSDDQKTYDLKFGVNKISESLYETPEEIFESYKTFLHEDLQSAVNVDFHFQTQMTIRLQTPHTTAQKFYPLFHSDIQFGHPPHEINVWIPLTEPSANEGHGFTLSSLNESEAIFNEFDFDIHEMNKNSTLITQQLQNTAVLQSLPVGSALLFDTRKFHSTLPLADHSRVSLDIRILPCDAHEAAKTIYTGIGRKKVKFAPSFAYSSESINGHKQKPLPI
ncbi:hypothetical protein N8979_00940, partial [bacterium]|nr:hypothetical protein [bacterium]